MVDCTLLILTYKGKHHLELLLPTVRNAIENSNQFKFGVLIVDNGKDEATANFVKQNYPEFKIEAAIENDYLFSLNAFVEQLKSPYVFILNDDMKLETDVLDKLMPLISSDDELFSVGCNVLNWEGSGSTVGVRILKYKKGWMRNFFIELPDNKLRYTLYGGGGAAVFNTAYFNKLGGFNELMRPAYGEDLDLGHRAWHKGWKSIIHPTAYLYHRDGATIKEQFTSDELEIKITKNTILWMLRNVDYKGFLFYFFLLLPMRFLSWNKLHKNLYIALKLALPKFGIALRQRFSSNKAKLNDHQIIKFLNTVYEPK